MGSTAVALFSEAEVEVLAVAAVPVARHSLLYSAGVVQTRRCRHVISTNGSFRREAASLPLRLEAYCRSPKIERRRFRGLLRKNEVAQGGREQ